MENFNDIKNKFETAFNAIEGEKTEFNLDQEYENIGATAKALQTTSTHASAITNVIK